MEFDSATKVNQSVNIHRVIYPCKVKLKIVICQQIPDMPATSPTIPDLVLRSTTTEKLRKLSINSLFGIKITFSQTELENTIIMLLKDAFLSLDFVGIVVSTEEMADVDQETLQIMDDVGDENVSLYFFDF